MTEPHPLDPRSKLNPEEQVAFQALSVPALFVEDGVEKWNWQVATEATTFVTSLHAIGADVCVGRDCPHDTHRDDDRGGCEACGRGMGWDPLPDQAHARQGDPKVSHVAADSIDNMKERHRAVLQIAQTFADTFTYDSLVQRYNSRREAAYPTGDPTYVEDLPAMEPQSIRSRAAELRRAGWIEQAGRGLSDAGRPCNTWRVVQ